MLVFRIGACVFEWQIGSLCNRPGSLVSPAAPASSQVSLLTAIVIQMVRALIRAKQGKMWSCPSCRRTADYFCIPADSLVSLSAVSIKIVQTCLRPI